jgi:FAD/FMN-containing dehydrogenase/Fe-S oxidoreductase
LDEQRARIFEDLRGMLAGDLLFEPIDRAPYAQDASLYEIDPLGVIAPRTQDDLVIAVRYAYERGIPIHARGAGTGLAGESLGPGLIVDFSRHFRRIVDVRADSVTVQPGVVLDVLNTHLAPLGRRIGPDPSGSASCTVGGMVAGDAAGMRSLKYGTTANHVERLRVVFANGEVGELGTHPWPSVETEPRDFADVVARRIALLLNWNAELIARKQPRSPRNRAGYALHQVAKPGGGLDLARLIVGSEGTLALVTEVTLRTVPLPQAQSAVLLLFGKLLAAAEAVQECLRDEPSACELFDWRSLSLVRDGAPDYRAWIADDAEAALVVEFEGDDATETARKARSLAHRIARSGAVIAEPVDVHRRADCDRLLGLRSVVTPLVMKMSGPSRPVPFVEDVAVLPPALPEFLNRVQQIFKGFGANWTVYAHAGDGQVHLRPFLDLSDAADVAKLEPMAIEIHEAAWDLGGSISGEHGCGLARSQFVRKQCGDLYPVLREVKNAFDPQNLLNPGKVVSDDPHLMTHDLRRRPGTTSEPNRLGDLTILDNPLRWPGRSRAEQVSACNACGACRSQEPSLRMCPTFRASRAEAATPRAQVGLLRQVASGAIDPKLWGTDELKANADLCIHCHLCESECPAGVDVSSLMLEAKAAFVEQHGMLTSDWLLSRVDVWARWASRFPNVSNAILGGRWSRWALDRLFGLSALRIMPRAHRWSFVHRADRLGLTKPRPSATGPRVAYFVDVFANYFDHELAEAVVAVLHHAGVNVYVPKGQRGSGMPALVAGDLDQARDLVLANLRVLGNAVRDGYTIVCSEPTAALMLRREALKLSDDLDAALVAENTLDLGHFLATLDARGLWPHPSEPIHAKVGYHQPCHLRALGVGTPGLDLIRHIPELNVEFIDRGCSGIAGTYGLARRNFRASLRAGRGLRSRLRDPDLELGATECSTCRMQMEQGLRKRTIHPIKLLSLAYGLNPALRQRLKTPKPKHLLS